MRDGWQLVDLGDLLTLEYGSALPERAREEGDVEVYGSNGRLGSHSKSLVPGPGIVIGRKGSVGKVVWSDADLWPIDTTYYVSLRQRDDLRWAFYLLSTLPLDRLDSSTGVPGLNRNDAYRVKVTHPPLLEQRRIARVLDTVDAAIRQTEAVIAKLKQVKAGLLHDLLTRGLDENGELRDPVRHPEQFKDSPLGRVPKEWEVVRCGDAFTMSSGKSRPKSVGQLPVYGGNGVSGYSNRALIGHSTLVVGRVGEYCGSVHITDGPAWITDNALYIREIELILDVHYLARFLTWFDLSRIRSQTGQPLVTQGTIAEVPLTLPPVDEQSRIASRAHQMGVRIAREERMAKKYRLIKQGLMQDLLTGRVRVPEEAVEGVAA